MNKKCHPKIFFFNFFGKNYLTSDKKNYNKNCIFGIKITLTSGIKLFIRSGDSQSLLLLGPG